MAAGSSSASWQLRQAYRLRGHEAPVLSCTSSGGRIASGAEDGRLLVHDLLHAASAGSEGPAVPPQPATTASQQPSTPTPAAAEGPAPAVARPLLSFTLHGSDDQPAAVTALCHDPSDASGCSLFAACGSVLHRVDTRTAGGVVQRYGSSREEVNGVAVSGKGAHLAAGDDAGEIQVYDLAAGKLFKGIRNVHRTICSSVAFRTSHRPWELLSGGLDSTVARYDFSRPKCVDRWEMGALTAASTAAAMGRGPAGGAAAGAGGGQIYNPPFVHQICVPKTDERPVGQWVAAARGDGAVVLLDADVSSSVAGCSGATSLVASNSGGRGGRRGGGGGGGGGGGQKGKGGAAAGLAVPLVLDMDVGGHSRPVCSVSFAPGRGGEQAGEYGACGRLYSGGEDKRVLVWDVAGIVKARQEGTGVWAGGVEESGEAGGAEGIKDGEAASAEEEGQAGEGGSGGGRAQGRSTAVLAEVLHPRKVNQVWAMALEERELVAVAAVSKFVTLYSLDCC